MLRKLAGLSISLLNVSAIAQGYEILDETFIFDNAISPNQTFINFDPSNLNQNIEEQSTREFLVSLQNDLQDIERIVEKQANFIKNTKHQLTKLLDQNVSIKNQPETNATFIDEKTSNQYQDEQLEISGLLEEQVLPKNKAFSSHEEKNVGKKRPLLKEGDKQAFELPLTESKNFFTFYNQGFITFGNTIYAPNYQNPMGFDTLQIYTVIPQISDLCTSCSPEGVYDCTQGTINGCGTTKYSFSYLQGSFEGTQSQSGVCMSVNAANSCVNNQANLLPSYFTMTEQYANVTTLMPGQTDLYYGGVVGLGPYTQNQYTMSYMYIWSSDFGTSDIATMMYSLEPGNSTIAFGDITGSHHELNERDFVGQFYSPMYPGDGKWVFQLDSINFMQKTGVQKNLTESWAYVASNYPFIGMPSDIFDEFMAQKPFKDAFTQYDPLDGYYKSSMTCDYISAHYCITNDYTLQFTAQAKNGIDEIYFVISPETFLRPLEDDGSCALMVVKTTGEPNGLQNIPLGNEGDFIFGLPFFFQYVIELDFAQTAISLYNSDPQSSVNIAICNDTEYAIVLSFGLSLICFLWVLV